MQETQETQKPENKEKSDDQLQPEQQQPQPSQPEPVKTKAAKILEAQQKVQEQNKTGVHYLFAWDDKKTACGLDRQGLVASTDKIPVSCEACKEVAVEIDNTFPPGAGEGKVKEDYNNKPVAKPEPEQPEQSTEEQLRKIGVSVAESVKKMADGKFVELSPAKLQQMAFLAGQQQAEAMQNILAILSDISSGIEQLVSLNQERRDLLADIAKEQ